MFSSLAVIIIFCAYMGILFALALWAEKRAGAGSSLVNNPVVYSLSLAVFCSSWTFFGSVGSAANSGILFLSIYLGPTLMIIFWSGILRKMVRLKTRNRITSIADFISARYEKSESLAALVTILALVGTVPYVALQLKAVVSTFTVITAGAGEAGQWVHRHVGPVVVGMMTLFTIMFGVRRLDPTERHEGMVMAVAVESMVKLVAFVAAGIFVAYWMYDGVGDILIKAAQDPTVRELNRQHAASLSFATWASYLVVAGNAILCLPRQFHIAVVENQSERHIRWAMWLFPLYLLIINFFVYPIAQAGLLAGYPISQSDTFVLKLPLDQGNPWLALVVFLGGFSAATSMILISSMTMATMISNHLLLPLVDWIPQLGIIERQLLRARWLAVAVFILMGYWFERLVGDFFPLVDMGMLSFVAVLQLAPALVGGLFWRGGNRRGAILGLLAGFAIWAYTLLLPAFIRAGWFSRDLMEHGPFGLELLRPTNLLGLTGTDPISHALFWSMLLNIGFYVLGSLWVQPSDKSQSQAEAFVGALGDVSLFRGSSHDNPLIPLGDKRRRIIKLFGRYFGPQRARRLTVQAISEVGLSGKKLVSIADLAELYDHVEKQLAGAIGSATANRALSQAELFTPSEAEELTEMYAEILADLRARPEDVKRKIDFYQEREALIQEHAKELEEKVSQLEDQMSLRREAELALRESEERYRLAIESSSDGVAVIRDQRIVWCNNRLAEIFGHGNRSHILGRSLKTIIHPDDQSWVLSLNKLRQEGHTVPTRYDFKGIKKDGSFLYIAVSAATFNYHGRLLVLAYLRDVTARRQAEEEIRHLSRRLIEGMEEERRRLAADLHDEFGQSLTALHLGVESLRKSLDPALAEQRDLCQKLISDIEVLADNMRKISSELRPDMLDHLGLVPTVEWFVDDFRQRLAGVMEVDFSAVGFGRRKLDPQVEIVLYRVLQEALNNAAKHSGARKLSVQLTYSHPQVIMVVQDNGRGFDKQKALNRRHGRRRGIGLTSMRERVAWAGGTIDIRSAVGKGTMVRVALPGEARQDGPGAPDTEAAATAGEG